MEGAIYLDKMMEVFHKLSDKRSKLFLKISSMNIKKMVSPE